MAGGDSPAEICVDSTGKKQLKTKKKTKKPKCQVASADSISEQENGTSSADPGSKWPLDIGDKVSEYQSGPTGEVIAGALARDLYIEPPGDSIDGEVIIDRGIALLDSGDALYQLAVPGTRRVLELQCVCEEIRAGSSRPTVVEQYNSTLTENTDQEEGSTVCRRQYRENATKSSIQRTDSGGEESEESSTIQYTERKKIVTSLSGLVRTETSVSTEEQHVETTSTYELVDDQVLKKALTRRRSSVSSASTNTSSIDTTTTSAVPIDTASTYSTMATETAANDKYIVSFNSDTSDSDDDDVTPISKSVSTSAGLMNGHAEEDSNVTYNIKLGKSDDKDERADLGTKTTSSTNSYGGSNSRSERDPASDYSLSVNNKVGTGSSDVGHGAKLTEKDSVGDVGINLGAGKHEKIRNNPEIDLVTSGASDGAGQKGSSSSAAHDVGRKHSYRKVGADKVSIDTDLLIDITGTAPQVSPKHTDIGANINSDLDGLSLHYSPKARGYKVSMEVTGDISDNKTNSDMEGRFSAYNDNTTRGYKQVGLVNGVDGHDLSKLDITSDNVVAMENEDKTDLLDADLLIYASPGTTTAPPPRNRFDFETEGESARSALSKTKSLEYETVMDDTSYRGREKFDRQVSMPDKVGSEKGKYRDLDEKFSAICNKYGRGSGGGKRDKIPNAADTQPERSAGDDMYGAVRVRTGVLDGDTSTPRTPTSPPIRVNRDEDSGFSEDTEARTPRQKLTFDDVVNWDKSSTDDLIKRILSDARDESSGKFRSNVISTASRDRDNSHDSYKSRYKLPEPYEKDMGGQKSYETHDDQPTLLERRLASLGGRDNKRGDNTTCSTVVPYNRYEAPPDEEPEPLYKRRSRKMAPEGDDDASSVTSAGSGRYVPWKQRQKAMYDDDDDDYSYKPPNRGYRGGSMLAIPSRYDDSDSDNESYVSRRSMMVPVLPDEVFKPQRSEDTDDVVRERTFEARTMVENQAEVLGRLKKAADSFDELDAEIKELKQHMMETQVARQTIMEDIMADIQEDQARAEAAPEEDPSPYSYQPQRYNRGTLQRAGNFSSSYTSPYSSSSYTPRYGRSRDTESCSRLDSDLESDRLGGYALGSVAKSKWGEPGGSRAFRSASVSRFDNVESERFDKYGLYNADSTNTISKRLGGCGHGNDDYDAKSDFGIEAGDDAETASIRSYPSEKSGAGGDGGDDVSSGSLSKYRPRASSVSRYSLSKYTPPTSYEPLSRYGSSTPSYTSSTRPSRSSVSRSFNTSSSESSSYERPRTRGTSMPPLESKPFTSRFLSKVREKRDSGADIKSSRDKPFKSRFLAKSFDSDYCSGSSSRGSLASTPDKNSSSPRSYRSRDEDVDSTKVTADDVNTEAA